MNLQLSKQWLIVVDGFRLLLFVSINYGDKWNIVYVSLHKRSWNEKKKYNIIKYNFNSLHTSFAHIEVGVVKMGQALTNVREDNKCSSEKTGTVRTIFRSLLGM